MKKIILFICLFASTLLAQDNLGGLGLQTKSPFVPITNGWMLKTNTDRIALGTATSPLHNLVIGVNSTFQYGWNVVHTGINKNRSTFAQATDTSNANLWFTAQTGKPIFNIKSATGTTVFGIDSAAAITMSSTLAIGGATTSGTFTIPNSAANEIELTGTGGNANIASGSDLYILPASAKALYLGSNGGNAKIAIHSTGNIGMGTGTTASYHKLTILAAIATNLNLFSFTNSDINKIRTTAATERDTSAIYAFTSSLGSPTFGIKSKIGTTLLEVDSASISTLNDLLFLDPGTSANSKMISLKADNSTTVQEGTIQVMYGADPYLRLSAPNDAGTATAIMDLKDQRVVIGAGGDVDYDIYMNGNTNQGTLTFMEDEDRWDFGESVKTIGGIFPRYLSGALTDGAPTDAEIDAITSSTPAGLGAGYMFLIKDTDGTGLIYMIISDGTAWQYTTMTIAL